MKRWWMAVVAGVLGIGLAVFIIPSPDTGGDTPDRAQKLPRIKSGDVPPVTGDEEWHPARKEPGVPGEVQSGPSGHSNPEGMGEGNPMSTTLAAARDTPEVRAVTKSATPWVQVTRLLRGVEGDPLVPELADRANELVRDLREARRDPYDVDYDDLEARQQQLAGLIRQTTANDQEMEAALSRVDDILKEFRTEQQAMIDAQ